MFVSVFLLVSHFYTGNIGDSLHDIAWFHYQEGHHDKVAVAYLAIVMHEETFGEPENSSNNLWPSPSVISTSFPFVEQPCQPQCSRYGKQNQ